MMKRDRITIVVCLLVAVSALGLSFQAGAARRMASPTVVATVDINRVREGLTERVDAQAGLIALAQKIESENTERLGKIEELQTEITDTVDPDQRQELQEELDLNLVRAAAWWEYIKQQVDIEKSLLLQDLFQKISDAVAELAEVEGINLVLVSDAGRVVKTVSDAQVARELQVRQQISTRRIMYASSTIDITEQLIIRMNNSYANEQGTR
ncbi:MAG: OmpH family outer membrane protein [Planctomycetota bacterium]|nr:OmpH family outer membrane protein [Planctomycetota bacterium]